MNVILYARFSPRPNSADCESCDRQLDSLRLWARDNGHAICGEFRDEAISGAEEDRPGLRQAIEATSRGRTMVVTTISRLMRDSFIADAIRTRIYARGGRLMALDGSAHADETPEQKLTRRILQSMAEYQREAGAVVTSEAMMHKQTRGIAMSAIAPYGYRIAPRKSETDQRMLEEHPGEQERIVAIMELHDTGEHTAGMIARILNCNGVPARGKRWCHHTVARIIRREKARRRADGRAPAAKAGA